MTVGEAFLSAFLQVLFDKLASREFIGFIYGKKYDELLEKLKITLLSVTALLNDAEEKQFHSPTVEKWLHMAKDAIYDAEDILDELATEALKLKSKLEAESEATKSDRKVWKNLKSVTSSFSPSGRGVESRLKKIIEWLELIAKYKSVLGLKDNSGERSCELKQRLGTTSLVEESCVYGRGDDKDMIVQHLLRDETCRGHIGVISIVGMGGIGKTTLAQLVYNDQRVDNHFDLKIWVCVTNQFDVVRVTKTILESITLKSCDLDDLNLLQVSLKEHLVEKRFMLVLDDVWSKRNSDWDVLWKPLKAGGSGSKIIVTTQNGDVAASMSTVPSHYLRSLPYEDCWLLFISQAFENKDKDIDVHPNLKSIGEKIVKRCQGLPLAVKRLGILLRSRAKEDEWKDILNRKIWDLPDEESDILQTLQSSYHHLPTQLKQCFAFCAVFPIGHEFDKDSIVLLWMAEGFLQQPKGNKRLEDVGHEYFCELVSRSFFEQSDTSSKFVMHSLLKELADFVSGEFCIQLEDKTQGGDRNRIFEKARHSSYFRGKRDALTRFEALNGVDCLRTFLPLDPIESIGVSYMANSVPNDLLLKLSYMRVLSFNSCRITKLSDSIGNLKHLRYLDLSYTAIRELPESTNTLYNLQTLNLSQCRHLTKLPSKMGNLKSLRHLWINGSRVGEMPLQLSELRDLQTLSNFVVGKDCGSGIRELRNMKQLRGSLQISGLQNIVNFVDAVDANMKEKQELEQLVFQWSNSFDDSLTNEDDEEVKYVPQHQYVSKIGYRSTRFPSFRETMDAYRQNFMDLRMEVSHVLDISRDERVETLVLEMLEPHKNIKKVTIKDYGGIKFPRWIGSPLFLNIKFLKISNCMKCDYLPALGQLLSLKDLIVEGMERIKSIGIEFYGDGHHSVLPFPSLETLKFENMLNWEDWSSSSGVESSKEFHHLQKIEIQNCPKLRKLSHCFVALKNMSIKGCEELIALPKLPRSHENIQEGREFPCLLELSIWECPKLNQLPNTLPSLTMLEIDGCQSLEELPKLPSIRDVELKKCKAEVLESIVALESLSYLRMCQILNLTSLPDGFFHNLIALEELHITHLNHLTTLSNKIGLHKLPCLQRMEISGCLLLEELPQSLHKLPSLKELRVWKCPLLESFPSTGLPSTLTGLEIKDCNALHSLPDWKTHDKKLSLSLEYLIIEGCSLLTHLPRDDLPNTLKELEIQDCRSLESLPKDLIHDNSLELLSIVGCHSITYFPAFHQPIVSSGMITNLKQLIINDCASLKLLPDGLQNLVHLDHIEIADCPLLLSFPESGLPLMMLRSLRLSNCRNLKSLPNHMHSSLTSLEGLSIEGCSSVSSFPEGGLPVNLISLSILDCEKLKPTFEWGLHRLAHLTNLVFGGCKELVCFPDEWLLPNTLSSIQLQRLPNLKMLPKGIENLSSLDDLEIWECDSLQTLFDDQQPKMLENFYLWDVL